MLIVNLSIVRANGSHDLHALSTPLAFILSQDQTLTNCYAIWTINN